jgi:serine protease
MKRLILLCLFLVGISFALFNFQGLASQGKYNSIVLDFKETISSSELTQELEQIARDYQQEANLNSVFSIADRIYTISGDDKLLGKLRKSSLAKYTESIEPNYLYFSSEVPNDPDYSKQWNFRTINVEQAWNETKGKGITVAVIDTGVSPVPDLKNTEFVEGYDFVNDRAQATDDNGHGTHVAGTIAQSTNNGYGVTGIAYEAKIMPLKVLSAEGGGTVSDIAESIRFAADNGADVINMSLGGGGESSLMKEAIDYAYNKGVVIIAAAGNANRNAAEYPARYPHVIGVSATDAAGDKAQYSNYGAGIDISAPGGSQDSKIVQNTLDPSTGESIFAGFQGTSMASPHVAGVATLVKAMGISQPDEIEAVLTQSARKINDDRLNHFGAGYLDAGSAIQLAAKGKISFNDFFRWLRDNGYLNLRFWIDGGAVALLPKILMVLGSYLLAWFLRNYLPMRWTPSLHNGLILGSSGWFFLQTVYVYDLPQWPMRLLGSSLPELGNAVLGRAELNPIFASALIPLGLYLLLAGNAGGRIFAIGTSLGVASCLAVSIFLPTSLWFFGSATLVRCFLGINALLCLGLVYLATKGERRIA